MLFVLRYVDVIYYLILHLMFSLLTVSLTMVAQRSDIVTISRPVGPNLSGRNNNLHVSIITTGKIGSRSFAVTLDQHKLRSINKQTV